MTQYHNPVLLEDALQGLDIRPEGIYVDVTFGGGGHSRALLDQLNEQGRLFAFDQDQDAHENRIEDSRFQLVAANFSHLSHYLKYHGISSVNGILADFGVCLTLVCSIEMLHLLFRFESNIIYIYHFLPLFTTLLISFPPFQFLLNPPEVK